MISSNEIQIHCPFCDDASRKNAASHGHLYISTDKCVFHCFRCGMSGSVVKLLIYTSFDDNDVIKLLSQNINYKFIKNITVKNLKLDNVINKIININGKFTIDQPKLFNKYKYYIFKRIGEYIDFTNYLIAPTITIDKYKKQTLSCQFYNANFELITTRFIDSRFRYQKNSNNLYYFQKKDFDKYKEITITEGAFDAINLDLYNNNFKNNFFISMHGKKYVKTIEDLILNELLIGIFKINLVYDQDYTFKNNNLKKCQTIAKKLNPEITIDGFAPMNKVNDVADFSAVQQIF